MDRGSTFGHLVSDLVELCLQGCNLGGPITLITVYFSLSLLITTTLPRFLLFFNTVNLIKSEADRGSHAFVSLEAKALVERLSRLLYLSNIRVCDTQSV